MAKGTRKKIAFVSSSLPNKCGIATFTSDLVGSLTGSGGKSFEPLTVAMQGQEQCQYPSSVKFEIRRNVKNDYICAADFINFSHVDMVSVQHEFGLFGGGAGSYLNLFLRRVNAPIISTLHTVLNDPTPDYFQSTLDVCDLSDRIIVMNERGIEMLTNKYSIEPAKISLIPHGIPDLPYVDSSYYKHKFGMEGRKTILTFGLLSKNKGIETMLKALPEIIKVDPTVLYIVLGATHPSVVRHDGEAYRNSLQRIVQELGIQKHVLFHNHFVTDEKLHNFLCAADIYVTPYRNKEQLTSGTLAFAVGTGKAVVSTPYWAAEELLSGGRGKLFKFDDSKELAESIVEILKDEEYFYSLRRKAYDYGRSMTWPVIGKEYWKLFNSKHPPVPLPDKKLIFSEDALSILDVPEPPLEHLKRLTDDTGLYQHAKYTIPNREHGYCTDDNARSLVAMTWHYAQYKDPEALRLFEIYLSFVHHAQEEDGSVHNYMGFDRQWFTDEPDHDALGRTLWALGAVMANPPEEHYIGIIKDCFDKSVKYVPELSIRGKSYAIFGMADYLRQFPGASEIKRYFAQAADELVEHYEKNATEDWQWFENILTYDNAVLPHALYVATQVTEDDKYLEVAEATCDFLVKQTFIDGHFSSIGCKGWYPRGGKRAKFDQQPLEVTSTVMMLQAAYDVTGNLNLLKLQRKAFDWFLGANDVHVPVYDFRTKGSGDGLESNGVNLNQGAESMVSFLLSLLCVVQSYNIASKKNGNGEFQDSSTIPKGVTAAIKDITSASMDEETLAGEPG